ncbi:J domain-containing protein [Ancylobacter mangrovi]|uniref:J domain-containing protein n=1 Tax=Ancylobacter mangrovi TaxID=2972472 RepID=A0A9X2PEU8_9HYPH|nr:J domain-containing protein [Ancylobacter mangrovi]MCS0497399.1 J domain-containing protein [Ancylobacter mangrovi]MCS0504051.1 J domain-containing protein [Ancylobacter mangrovi]
MKFDSPIFDRIRVKPDRDRRLKAEGPVCEWQGCCNPATHRAPKGRDREGQFWRYCFDHVREYNQSYNYFSGMPDEDVMAYQKDAMTGHRPTWKMGSRGGDSERRAYARHHQPEGFVDPFGMFGEVGGSERPEPEAPRENRMIRNAERRAFESLGVEISATPQEIKARFKLLVKKYHPDANGGDISTEDRLRDVIQAYNHLKSAGYC